jgi:hypothetical protein
MGAFRRLAAALIGEPVLLPARLVGRYPELSEVQWRRGGLPPRIGGWALGTRSVAAITLWRTVFLAPETEVGPELLLHELAHVQQFQDSRAFPVCYLWESVRVGYSRNRYEIAARRFATARLHAPASSSPEET